MAIPPLETCRGSQRTAVAGAGVDDVAATVICRDFVTVPKVAETIAHPLAVRDDVKGKIALSAPAGTVTEAGIPTPVLVVLRPTTAGLAAAEVSVSVHIPPMPGTSTVGVQTRSASEDAVGERAIGKDTVVCPT